MRIVPADQRFTETRFSTGDDYPKYPTSFFACGGCSFELGFVLGDFMRHDDSDFTNLTDEDDQRIRGFLTSSIRADRSFHLSLYSSFLDFYCPQCSCATRVYYLVGEMAGSRRESYGYSIEFVVEDVA